MASEVLSPAIPGLNSRSVLRPSIYDVFFVVITLWLFVADPMGWGRLLMDGDTAFHIRIGDYVVAHGQVPTHDMFSFSVPGKEWYAFEWLSEVAFACLHGTWGLKGVVLLSGLIISLVFTLLWNFSVWSGANSGVALITMMLGLSTSAIHFHARPHIFTWLFLVIVMWVIARDRRQDAWTIWLLPPLTAVWANFHGGFFLLFPLLVLLVLGTFLEGRPWQRYALVTAACAAASLVNPYGWSLHMHIGEVLRAKWILDLVDEFRSPSFRGESMLVYMGLLFLGLATATRHLQRRQLVEPFWIAFLAYASLTSIRHAPVFVLVAVPIIAVELSGLWESWVSRQGKASITRILDDVIDQRLPNSGDRLSIWVSAFALFLAVSPTLSWPRGFSADLFPVELVDKYQARLATSRVFSTDQWSGYLVYKNYPQQRIFIDGRHNYYGEKFLRETLAMTEGQSRWKEIFEGHRFDLVLSNADSPLVALVTTLPGWRVLERAGKNVILERTKL